MVPIRLRHSEGVSTIQVDLENWTVADLQQAVFSCCGIPISLQELKSGYPPRALTLIPSLPISSLGLQRGEQLTVASASGGSRPPSTTPHPEPQALIGPKGSKPTLSAAKGNKAEPADSVRTPDGMLVLRVVPDDNSCLFSAVGLVFEQSLDVAPKLRQLVANTIKHDPITYDEGFLGMPPKDYVTTITKPNSWGGAIELAIFAEHYKTEISSFDVETGRCDRFGEGKWDNRCILMYSGIHYDAVSLAPRENALIEWHQTVFPVSLGLVFKAATELATLLRSKKAFTNTSTFDLRCEVCKKGLRGEKEARKHASETGHVEFGEY